MKVTGTPSRALLCLHGTGSSAQIFRIQLSKIRLALKGDFEFIFVDAPIESGPGPGVLPLFAGADPYYCWFGIDNPTIEGALLGIHQRVREAVQEWEASKTNPEARIVGLLSFSEGALVSSLLLWQQQLGLVPWLPKMDFAVLICCYFLNEATSYIRADAKVHGRESVSINVPTLHLHGRRDFCLSRAQKLVKNHYEASYADVMEFDGGHHCPLNKDEHEEMRKRILRLAQR